MALNNIGAGGARGSLTVKIIYAYYNRLCWKPYTVRGHICPANRFFFYYGGKSAIKKKK